MGAGKWQTDVSHQDLELGVIRRRPALYSIAIFDLL